MSSEFRDVDKIRHGSSAETPETPFTIWTLTQRRLLVCLLGYLALASSLTANIYFPLTKLLSDKYDVSLQAINLTITVYMVFQGISPSFWSPFSDSFGRRPVYLATFLVYTGASMGLSILDRNYPALVTLRALQSVGGSAVLSLAYAVVADVTVHSERGAFLAPMMVAANIGPCIGPILGGGAILASGDPRWCFRALLIFGGSGVLLIGWTMPETARTIVGNGALPARGLWRPWWITVARTFNHLLAFSFSAKPPISTKSQDTPLDCKSQSGSGIDVNRDKPRKGKAVLPNPLPSFRLVFHADTSLILWLAASPYALWFAIQASITPIFGGRYHFNPLEVGLCFLAGGFGVIMGGLIASRLMDLNYKKVAHATGFTVNRVMGDNMDDFPIEQARSYYSVRILSISMLVVIGYGWVVEQHLHPSVPLVFQAYIGCKCTVLLQVYSALIVDIFPGCTGKAAASNNITRCTLAAGMVAVLEPLMNRIGYGWGFTFLGLVDGITCIGCVMVLRRKGPNIRAARARRLLIE